jgi:aspartate kinase
VSLPRPIIVQKFGGSSVSTIEKLKQIAQQVVERHRSGSNLVVVVSAMGDTTNSLLSQAHAISPEPNRRELDMLLTVGERISMSLLAMAIRECGAEAVSLTGSQSGIITTASHSNARIMEVRPFRIQDELEHQRIVIVAGYQGVSYKREITTLSRGGSDTTAVALAAALNAQACEIYSDVDGVLSADPRIIDDARKIEEIGYEEMQEMAAAGAKVLNTAAVEFAKQKGIAIYAKKTGSESTGTVIRRDIPPVNERHPWHCPRPKSCDGRKEGHLI